MKKILTFLMMFAMTAGILSAQNTNLSYQVVVRDAQNNLVVDQDVDAYVTVLAPEAVYSEVIPGHTNHNGMLSLTIGQEPEMMDEPVNADFPVNPFAHIDWSIARIHVDIQSQEETIMSYEEPVYAVPYALQSGFLLTTPQIVDYITAEIGNGQQDVEAIVAALRGNQPFLTAIRDTVVEYVKNHYDISKRVIRHYMHEVSGNDVRHAYNYYERRIDSEVKDEILKCVKKYLRRHRSMAMELAKYYLRTTNAAEIDALYEELTENNQEVYDFMKSKVDVVLDEYMTSKGFNCLREHNFSNLCDLKVAAENMVVDPTDVCPRIVSLANTSNDGLVALALNRGIVLTAYVKNKQENVNYGFLLSQDNTTFTPETPVYYYSFSSNNFGKIVDTMDNSALCGKTLYAKAYMEQTSCSDNPGTLWSDVMEFTVPTFSINAPENGDNTVTFSPAEAQTVFNADGRRNRNVWWYNPSDYDTTTNTAIPGSAPVHTGDTYNVAGTYTVVAKLGECRVFKTEITIQ